jgi:hypothetical protein
MEGFLVSMFFIGFIEITFGSTAVYYVLIILLVCLLIFLIVGEMKEWYDDWKEQKDQDVYVTTISTPYYTNENIVHV